MEKRRRFAVFLLTIAGLSVPSMALAGTASLDTDFSIDGKHRLDDVGPRGSGLVSALDVVNGKTYVLGTLNRSESETGWYLARFLPDGTPDLTYGGSGVAIPPLNGMGGLTPYSFDLFVGEDGSAAVSYQNFREVVVTRWTAAGELDPDFSLDGIRSLPVSSNKHFSLSTSVSVDLKDRVVVAGTHTFINNHGYASDLLLYRLRPSGSLDPKFSHDGRRVIDYFRRDRPTELTTDLDGRVLLGGYHQSPYRPRGGGFFFRFTQGGALDESFSRDGFLAISVHDVSAYPSEVVVGADGRITASIGTANGAVGGLRLQSDGRRDKTYGDNGVAAVLCSCNSTHADVDRGRVVLTTQRIGHHRIHVISVSGSGSVIRRYLGTLVPKGQDPFAVNAFAVEDDRFMVGLRRKDHSYIARLSLAP